MPGVLHVCGVARECVVAKGFPFAKGIYQKVQPFRLPFACLCVRVFVGFVVTGDDGMQVLAANPTIKTFTTVFAACIA